MINIADSQVASSHLLWRDNRRLLCEDHRAGRTQLRGRPVHLKIELTNFCNLACPMCPHPRMRRPVGYMDPALFRKIITEATPQLEFAYLHHLGESLFHGRIGELIRYARSCGVRVGLSTNATILSPRKARALLEAGLDLLVISLDAATPATYARMRVGARWASTLHNVHHFLELKRRLGSRTAAVIQMVVTDENQHEVAAFTDQWRRCGEQVMIKEARDWAGQVPLRLPGRQNGCAGPCRMLWTELTVLWDGTVVPCANHFERHNVLGDLRQQSLTEVWNGPAMKALRAAHLQNQLGQIPVCGTCPRHSFEYETFIAADQLAQRLAHYRLSDDLSPRPGLS
ncbi:MAG: radical SAM protein [Myxococcales bacterium]|nr:radical SAM protein [Myxococcota bacterium]MDW8283778.1 radical SAM protein [Myxococcales bacterium]